MIQKILTLGTYQQIMTKDDRVSIFHTLQPLHFL